jgi:hypothetical protein
MRESIGNRGSVHLCINLLTNPVFRLHFRRTHSISTSAIHQYPPPQHTHYCPHSIRGRLLARSIAYDFEYLRVVVTPSIPSNPATHAPQLAQHPYPAYHVCAFSCRSPDRGSLCAAAFFQRGPSRKCADGADRRRPPSALDGTLGRIRNRCWV